MGIVSDRMNIAADGLFAVCFFVNFNVVAQKRGIDHPSVVGHRYVYLSSFHPVQPNPVSSHHSSSLVSAHGEDILPTPWFGCVATGHRNGHISFHHCPCNSFGFAHTNDTQEDRKKQQDREKFSGLVTLVEGKNVL